MELKIQFEFEAETERWIADLEGIPGFQPLHVYGKTQAEAAFNVKKAALQSLVWAMDDGLVTELEALSFSLPMAIAA